MMWFDWNTMGFFGWAMMILFWGTIIALLIWAVRSATTTGSSTPDALSILERRYAGGEIEREEFEERKRILVESRRTGS